VTISCGQARRVLWPDAGPHAVTQETELAEQHVAECAECQLFLKEMTRIGRLTHELVPRAQAPREVRDRLFKAVARARTGSPALGRRRMAGWVGLAAMLAVFAGIALEWGRRGAAPSDPLTGLAEDHMRATRGDGLVSGDSASVSRWLAARLPFAMDVPDLPGLRIRGARLCIMDGQRGGVVEYVDQGHSISYFVVPEWQSVEGPAPTSDLQSAVRAGYRLVAWREPGLVHALVGNLPEAKLVALARLCIQKAMALLTLPWWLAKTTAPPGV
jgi:anti-sigma factor RsiW